jgi:hypothetical protein
MRNIQDHRENMNRINPSGIFISLFCILWVYIRNTEFEFVQNRLRKRSEKMPASPSGDIS